MGKKTVLTFLLFIALLMFKIIYSHLSTYEYSLQKRTEIALQNNKDIHVAIVWDKNDRSFIEGVTQAVEEINQRGIILKSNNKTVKARFVLHEYDDSTEQSSLRTRSSIVADHKIVAVLGHSTSASAIPASISYEYNGVLFISVVATMQVLTNHNFKYTFSTIPSENFFADELVRFIQKKKWYKLLILHARNPYGLGFYETFVSRRGPPIQIVNVKSFFTEQQDYKELIYTVMKDDFDAVILAAAEENAAKMINQLRDMGMEKPILGGDGLDNLKIWDWSGHTANHMYVASVLEGQNHFDENINPAFSNNYVIYQGYEAAHILADAIEKTGTTEPIAVASTLKYSYSNGYGGYIFDTNGLITNKKLYIKEFRDGKFLRID